MNNINNKKNMIIFLERSYYQPLKRGESYVMYRNEEFEIWLGLSG